MISNDKVSKITLRASPLDDSDDALIQQFKDGDRDVFNALIDRYFAGIHRRVQVGVPSADVDDVVQEIFFAAFRSVDKFRGEAKFSTWLRSLAERKIAEYYRRRERGGSVTLLKEEHRPNVSDLPNNIEDRIQIQQALQKLSERYREIILMRFGEYLQFNEIAEKLGQSLEATKSIHRRAISALRDIFEENETNK